SPVMDFLLFDVTLMEPPDYEPARVAAVEVRHGKIEKLWQTAPQAWPDLPREDGQGARLLPGFCDSHVHAISSGVSLLSTTLSGLSRLSEVCEALAQAVRARPNG